MKLSLPAGMRPQPPHASAGVLGWLWPRPRDASPEAFVRDLVRMLGVERATRHYLLYFVLPLWIAAGLADWWRHPQTDIEHTAGTHESMIHALMMAEIGPPLLMGLFLEIDASVLLAMIGTFFVHEATAFWDVAYAETVR